MVTANAKPAVPLREREREAGGERLRELLYLMSSIPNVINNCQRYVWF
jgi:hypothetical protein